MSTKHVRTGADVVRFGASVRIECGFCGNIGTLDGVTFAQACGSGPLRTAARRLKCSRCGAKEARIHVMPPA